MLSALSVKRYHCSSSVRVVQGKFKVAMVLKETVVLKGFQNYIVQGVSLYRIDLLKEKLLGIN